MARIGKIAWLPLESREELNRHLADGEAGGPLLLRRVRVSPSWSK